MKTYSVKETAEMLGTTEETVCRWIRLGKLKANAPSKDSEASEENSMNEFVQSIPAYAQSMASSIADMITSSAKFVTTFIKSVREADNTRYSSVDSDEIKRLLKEQMIRAESSIQTKKSLLQQFEAEIEFEEEKLRNSQKQMSDVIEPQQSAGENE